MDRLPYLLPWVCVALLIRPIRARSDETKPAAEVIPVPWVRVLGFDRLHHIDHLGPGEMAGGEAAALPLRQVAGGSGLALHD